jgi:hypothetical protein
MPGAGSDQYDGSCLRLKIECQENLHFARSLSMRPQRGLLEIAVCLFIKIAHALFSCAASQSQLPLCVWSRRDVHAAFALCDRAQNTSLDLPATCFACDKKQSSSFLLRRVLRNRGYAPWPSTWRLSLCEFILRRRQHRPRSCAPHHLR